MFTPAILWLQMFPSDGHWYAIGFIRCKHVGKESHEELNHKYGHTVIYSERVQMSICWSQMILKFMSATWHFQKPKSLEKWDENELGPRLAARRKESWPLCCQEARVGDLAHGASRRVTLGKLHGFLWFSISPSIRMRRILPTSQICGED